MSANRQRSIFIGKILARSPTSRVIAVIARDRPEAVAQALRNTGVLLIRARAMTTSGSPDRYPGLMSEGSIFPMTAITPDVVRFRRFSVAGFPVYHYKAMPALSIPQTLLIDADDTLWENNVYFDQAIADFIERLNHQHLSPAEVKAFLYEVERETVLERGYGSHSFSHSLVKCFERLSEKPVTPELHEFIWGFAHKVSNYPIELIAGVPETLNYLAGRGHRMVVMTKGDFTEQSGKVERSGIKDYFAAVEIVAEKTESSYKEIVAKYEFEPQTTWMVGNSPRSDINPALAAGINAVFVPHDLTWALEHETVNPAPAGLKLLQVEKFVELQEHF